MINSSEIASLFQKKGSTIAEHIPYIFEDKKNWNSEQFVWISGGRPIQMKGHMNFLEIKNLADKNEI